MNMIDNWHAAFKGHDQSPLYGKPLVYLIGAESFYVRSQVGAIVEPPFGEDVPGNEKIAYLNLFNENYSRQSDAERAALGPYLYDSDTALEFGEGKIDPGGPGWTKNIGAQFNWAVARGFRFVELDNADAYPIGVIQSVVTLAHSYGFAVIAKNPILTNGALQFISHSNVAGVIVERGAGGPAEYDSLRRQARKEGVLPIWFVFDGRTGADDCVAEIRAYGFTGMGVTYSTGQGDDGYNNSQNLFLPTV